MAAFGHCDLEGCLTANMSFPLRKSVLQRAGRLRKYEGSWFSSNKGIHFAELMLKKLRAIKSSYRLSSDDAAVKHLMSTCASF